MSKPCPLLPRHSLLGSPQFAHFCSFALTLRMLNHPFASARSIAPLPFVQAHSNAPLLLLLGFAGLATLLVHGARSALLGFVFGDAPVFVRFFDMLVLAVALASLFDSSRHNVPPFVSQSQGRVG